VKTGQQPEKTGARQCSGQRSRAKLSGSGVALAVLLLVSSLNASENGMADYHFGLGMWIRNNWGLWGGSRLSQYFNRLGIHHPDDMSGIILDSYWRKIHGKPIDLDGQVRCHRDFWEKAKTNEGG
jgi:hypothetical protein